MEIKIAVIGLGYVGLPLARLFSTKYPTVGFDMNQHRVDAVSYTHLDVYKRQREARRSEAHHLYLSCRILCT